MQWTEVTSSNIEALCLVEDVLNVRFKGGKVYAYPDVGEEIFQRLVSAESVGKMFNALIRSQPDRFPPRLVEG